MATATELRNVAVTYMTSREKLNSYTQGAKRGYFFGYPDNKPGNKTQKGYSDCSSACRAAIKAATGIDIGSNTSAQINNRTKKGIVVHSTDGYYPDESKLLPGDCIYFKGNTSHPLDVGHVEMYIGNGKCCGHGSGTGPKVRNMRDYCKSRASSSRRYFMAVRWILDDTPAPEKDKILRKGMTDSEDVRLMQRNLITLGYDVGPNGESGNFDAATESAVIAFQAKYSLETDGEAGPITLGKIAEVMEGMGDNDEPNNNLPLPIIDGVTIAAGSWNVRTGPSTDSKAAGVVHGGDVLEKIELNGWISVLYNGEVRFIGPSAVKK